MSKTIINRASKRSQNVLKRIEDQVSDLKRLNLRQIDVPAARNLKEFKAWMLVPRQFHKELAILVKDTKNSDFLKKIGIRNMNELMQQEWLLRFYKWEIKTNKQSDLNQKLSFSGTLLEKKILNDPRLHSDLSISANSLLKLLQEEMKNKPVTFKDGTKVPASEFSAVKATEFVDLNGRDFLDFGYLFISKNGAGNKLLSGIEGQIKKPGVVHKYYYGPGGTEPITDPNDVSKKILVPKAGQGDQGTSRFPKGFSCKINEEVRFFSENDILLNEDFDSGFGKALIHPDENIKHYLDYSLTNTSRGRFTTDITIKTSTEDIKAFILELYKAKINALGKKG